MAPTFVQFSLLSLFTSSLFVTSNAQSLRKRALAVTSTLPSGWVYSGCYTEATNGRALSGGSYTDGKAMTEESCVAYCAGKGFVLAGTEYSSECYCGNSLNTGANTAAAGDCSMACSGNATEPCGGPNRLTVFNHSTISAPPPPSHDPGPPGWSFLGCYVDGTARTLTTPMAVTGGGSAMTVALCTSACSNGKYSYAGLEYAGECYCGNAFSNGGGPAPDGLSGCNMLCNGNSSEYCGGPNRLDTYATTGTKVTSSSAQSSGSAASTTSSAVVSTTTTPSAPTGLPTGWSYQGCYVDNAQGRIMSHQNADSSSLTVENCVASCQSQGYSVAGMEYSSQCFCDNGIMNGGALASADSQCSNTCSGNAAEKCGAGNRMSIYSLGNVKAILPPAAQKSGLPGSWTYQGCITEPGQQQKIFKYQIILPNNNTATNCLSQCSTFGYGAGGMEYGRECYCGDASDLVLAGSTKAPESDCSIACTGNSSYLCGGGNRVSYYTWTGTPLQTWHTPTGNNSGQYQFLIGGVIIPLITTAGINGKVTFVEKWGTGPANTTGAYELDLAQLNNFTGAWRPMHVKTDVFCSAGLTLPDKAGRQINIGGWSGDSTYGVRIYWPDGSPGVWGKNDWQENRAEVHLQIGRWYPSAMIMANGSVLVVGGENGSNGPAVPSMEILPQPAGGSLVTQDFLQRTDPYNLYPFLAVLPGGGIFIAYYNEARILDEGSLATTKVLPGLPGSVNNFQGGRTYPLEGTMVLFPQYAPYTDPVTVLICGGSTPGPALAIDNCISMQPENPSSNWTIERMPSQRVMSCMTALPDGTYLILNGATQGVAGFGLASNPNLGAVLYDPTQPVNARMTIMANTTVARLYHSEAILLQDGRVLVSGSDPEDGVNPQEYRNEVFIPPYLLSGKAKPTFNMTNMDWTYGQTVSFTLTSGSTANLRVSLLGAVSSTHGNSMGQRTIFPAFACNGKTCTLTAPPDAHTCPPGWFQVFVLDGPTPSNSIWVRIGGDPAKLGNWPKYPDFTIPGV
ncbi:hypothetical protein MMC25_008090 [Agyrium rufum]|nr:hypothetical protein [Agyrium rufum]